MLNKVLMRLARASLMISVLVAYSATSAQAKPTNITLGKADMIHVNGNVADVLVADPNIIDVMAVQSNKLYVVGLSVGDTNLIALDAQGNTLSRIDIHVKYDLDAIQALVEDLFPDEKVKIGAIHDQVLMTGTVSTPEKASRITDLVAHYVGDLQNSGSDSEELISNLMDVRGEQQVMLQVKIVEATRSVLKELGVETSLNNPNGLATSTIFGNTPPSSLTGGGTDALSLATGAGIGLSTDPAAMLGGFFDTSVPGLGILGLMLSALEEENLVNVLAEPNLTAVSGEEAGFLAGGEFPVPVGRDQQGNIVLEFREFGVSLNFKPIVMSENRISLQLKTEVSSLDTSSAVVLSGINVPGLNVRRADTTVEIGSGNSLMIAGLLQSEAISGMAGLPGISKTPILGDLVSSDSFKRDETELVVIVTPYLVEPYAEKKRAQPVPKQYSNPLAKSFAGNMRRNYKLKEEDESLFAQDQNYGYILN
jgi:pilus assembly protein CpaC